MSVLAVLGFGAIEITEVARTKAQLQNFVDAAALRGAREYGTDASPATVERSRVQADTAANAVRADWAVTTTARSDLIARTVTVVQYATRPSFFGSLLPPGGFQVQVRATATTLVSKSPLCVLGMQSGASGIVEMRDSSILTASACLVQSNTDVQAKDASQVRAGAVRAVGAATGRLYPAPVTDAPAIGDPFAAMSVKVPTRCDTNDLDTNGSIALNPGVHCGNIRIRGTGRLLLNPGDHYFLDAQIDVLGQGEIVGTDVVLIFAGRFDATFKGQAYISVEGRKSGPYAGFVLITDRSFTNTVEISTTSARKLLGTLYLPNAQLRVSGKNKVADQSPWTIVVAKSVQVEGSAELVINSNYFSSAVPVPSGVSTPGGTRLVK